MSQALGGPRRSSFVSGVIEGVRTGAKEPFRGIEAVSALIARMVQAEIAESAMVPRAPGARGQARSRPADGETRP